MFEQRNETIYLTPSEGEPLSLPIAWWLNQEPLYESAPRREYLPLERHSVWTQAGDQIGGPLPWPEGDAYLAQVEAYRIAYEAFLQAEAEAAAAAALPQTLAEALEFAKVEINRRWQESEFGNFSFEKGGTVYEFQADRESQARIQGTAARALRSGLPADFVWKTADNQLVPFTATEFADFAEALWQHGLDKFSQAQNSKAQLTLLADSQISEPEKIAAILAYLATP